MWRVRVTIKGSRPISKTFKRKTDAQRWGDQQEADIRRGLAFPQPEGRKRTVAEAIDRYAAEALPHKAATTQSPQRTQLAWWKARLGSYFLADVTPAMLVDARAALCEEGKSLDTWNNYRAVLSGVYDMAMREWDWAESNPVKRVRASPAKKERVRFLDDGELAALRKALAAHADPYVEDVALLALHTGARKSEIMYLRWRHIDFERAQLRFMDTKNKDSRVVPLSDEALAILRRRNRLRHLHSDLVFPSKVKPSVPAHIDRAWREVVRAAGLQDFRFHDLRHTAASWLAMAGCSDREIGEVLGHRDNKTVRRYAHLCDAHTRGVVNKLADRMRRGAG